jgi:glutamate carboxypeptidase
MKHGTLVDWVNINSGSTNLKGLSRMADALEASLSDIPGTLERIPLPSVSTMDGGIHQSGDALRLRFRPDAPVRILFSGHMDTVFDADHSFQSLEATPEGVLHGPGVADMKGGLYIMIEAVKRFLKTDKLNTVGGEILINADEELGSMGSQDLLREAAEWNHLGLVFESCLPGGELVRCRKGTGTFKVTAHGKAAHTGRDFEKGRNAVAALSSLLVECHALNGKIPEAIVNVGNFMAPGPVNVVPDTAEAWLNIRIGRPESVQEIKNHLDRLIQQTEATMEGIRIDIAGDFLREPKTETPGNAALHNLWNQAEEKLGFPPAGKRDTGGSSDGNVIGAAGLPHLDGIGIMGGDIHSDKEYALADSIDRQIDKTVEFLNLVAQQPESFSASPFC